MTIPRKQIKFYAFTFILILPEGKGRGRMKSMKEKEELFEGFGYRRNRIYREPFGGGPPSKEIPCPLPHKEDE